MLQECYRMSPIQIEKPVLRRASRNGWDIIERYQEEGDPPWLIDLSHIQKMEHWHQPLSPEWFLKVSPPEKPGECKIQGQFISARLNEQRSLILNLSKSLSPLMENTSVTDLTDAFALLAIIGRPVFDMMHSVTPLDVFPPGKRPPFVLQGPILGIRSLLMPLMSEDGTPAVLVAVPRGFGQSFSRASLQAGEPWHLSAAGEAAFIDFLEHVQS